MRFQIPRPSASLLPWLLILATLTGAALVSPRLGAPIPADVLAALRSIHGAASFLLVIGGIAHALLRVLGAPIAMRANASGYAASLAVALAALTGAALSDHDWWLSHAAASAPGLRHILSVAHFAYSGALALIVVYVHGRPRRPVFLAPLDAGSASVLLAVLAAGILAAIAAQPEIWTLATIPHDGAATLLALPTAAFLLGAWKIRRLRVHTAAGGPK